MQKVRECWNRQNRLVLTIQKSCLTCVPLLGSSINHVDRFLNIFDPLPPSWIILLNKAYVVIWTFGKPPSPLTCPHGLWMPPKVWTPCFDQFDLVESVNYRKRDWLELEIKPIIVKAFLWLMNLVAILFVLDICTITELGRIPIFI